MIDVLLVDDDPWVRFGLATILGTTDDLRVVGEANNGAEAIRQVLLLRPVIVLMDLRMPAMDGIQATSRITSLPSPPKILVLTTFNADKHVVDALDAGASGYLLKDTPPAEIIDGIRQTVAGKAILSPDHTRVLLDTYTDGGTRSQQLEARTQLGALTKREQEVVRYVAAGFTNAEIASQLRCSPATVKTHLASIFATLGLSSRVQLAILGHDAGL